MRPIIAITNQDLARHTALADIRSPVTVEHSLYSCPRCDATCWIGPKHKEAATTSNEYEVLCYKCLFADPEFAEQIQGTGVLPMVDLNPDIENAPRRWQ